MLLVIESILGGLFGFICGFNITSEILKLRLQQSYNSEFIKAKEEDKRLIRIYYIQKKKEFLENVEHVKNNSKIRFSNILRYWVIPNVSDLSSNTLDKLWYKSSDYNLFKNKTM